MRIPECFPKSIEYLGDGAYVGHDSFQVWVAAERDGATHRVALGAAELQALFAFAARLGLIEKAGK